MTGSTPKDKDAAAAADEDTGAAAETEATEAVASDAADEAEAPEDQEAEDQAQEGDAPEEEAAAEAANTNAPGIVPTQAADGAEEAEEAGAEAESGYSVNVTYGAPDEEDEAEATGSQPVAAPVEPEEEPEEEDPRLAAIPGLDVSPIEIDMGDDDETPEEEDEAEFGGLPPEAIAGAGVAGAAAAAAAANTNEGDEAPEQPAAQQPAPKKGSWLAAGFNILANGALGYAAATAVKAGLIGIAVTNPVVLVIGSAVAVATATSLLRAGMRAASKKPKPPAAYGKNFVRSFIWAAVGATIGVSFGEEIGNFFSGSEGDAIAAPDLQPESGNVTVDDPLAPVLEPDVTPEAGATPEGDITPEGGATPENGVTPEEGLVPDTNITPENEALIDGNTTPDAITTPEEAGALGDADVTEADTRAVPETIEQADSAGQADNAAEADNVVTFPAPTIVSIESGDSLWNIVTEHYGLTSNADIQLYTDAVAVANDLTQGASANLILPGGELTLPSVESLADYKDLALDWNALDTRSAAPAPRL